jgi:hypothetical protein
MQMRKRNQLSVSKSDTTTIRHYSHAAHFTIVMGGFDVCGP